MERFNLWSEWGILITVLLISIPVIIAAFIVIYRTRTFIQAYLQKREADKFTRYLQTMSPKEKGQLEERDRALAYRLSDQELGSDRIASDSRGLIDHVQNVTELRFIEKKKKSQPRPNIDPALSKLILWYLG